MFVKKRNKLIAFMILMGSTVLSEDFRFRENFITISTSAGNSLFNYTTNSFSDANTGFSITGGYTWKYGTEFFFTLEGGIERLSSRVYYNPSFSIVRKPEYDSDNQSFALTSAFSEFKESDRAVFFNIHPKLGYDFDHWIYITVGLKMGKDLVARSYSTTKVTNTAIYDEYLGVFRDLPDQGLVSNKRISTSHPLKLGFNASATIELGADLYVGTGYKSNILRAGFFFDYGLVDIYRQSPHNTSRVSFDDEDIASFELNPILTYTKTSARANTLYTGIKLTYYYSVKKLWVDDMMVKRRREQINRIKIDIRKRFRSVFN